MLLSLFLISPIFFFSCYEPKPVDPFKHEFKPYIYSSMEGFPILPKSSSPEGGVIISEIGYLGTYNAYTNTKYSKDEYIELYNYNAYPIDLSMWQILGSGIGSKSINFPPQALINANDFLVIANASVREYSCLTQISRPQAILWINGLQLNNQGENYKLLDPDISIIDEVDKDSIQWKWSEKFMIASLERNLSQENSTTNTDWFFSSTSAASLYPFCQVLGDRGTFGTPGLVNSSTPVRQTDIASQGEEDDKKNGDG